MQAADSDAGSNRAPPAPFHFTPTSSSWLNLVEPWFATITEKTIQPAHRFEPVQDTAGLKSHAG